jgi:hypothetical protein
MTLDWRKEYGNLIRHYSIQISQEILLFFSHIRSIKTNDPTGNN